MSYNRKKREITIKERALDEGGEKEIAMEEERRKKRPLRNCLRVSIVFVTLFFYFILLILFIFMLYRA